MLAAKDEEISKSSGTLIEKDRLLSTLNEKLERYNGKISQL